ncbi:hypothetical protein N7456_003622 [Penicillium angulare]|uniref:Uncharacterized protein n=1 Tax=Penicillium angulare TaxID=116970 RepID=A0A9W9FV51_9EURO|nr:hypothetical protein N7456_003622 [Penicillium angulare]
MAAMVMSNNEPLNQIAALKESTNSLQESSTQSGLTYHAKEELRQLLTVICLSERHLESQLTTEPSVQKKLQVYQSILEDLQKLQKCTGTVDSQSIIEDIRALLSDVVFGLSIMNAHMIVSSQNSMNLMLRDYIIEVATRRRDAYVLSSLFNADSQWEKDKAWDSLQKELEDFGMTPEQSGQEQDFILTTLRKAALESRLLGNIIYKPSALDIPDPPSPTTFTNSSNAGGSSSSVYSNSSSESPSSEASERASQLDFQMPVSVNVGAKQKQRLTLQTFGLDDFRDHDPSTLAFDYAKDAIMSTSPGPIAEASEPNLLKPSAMDTPVIPSFIPGSTTDDEFRCRSASEGNVMATPSTPTPQTITQVTAGNLKGKRPGLMSRMKYKMSSNKDEFSGLIKSGDVEAIKTALDRGASANTENSLGQPILIVAVSNGHQDVVTVLLDYGARVDTIGAAGDTALSLASSRGFEDIAQMLLTRGANPNAATHCGKTALSQAAVTGNMTLTHLLLDFGAEINAYTVTGETALSYAAGNDHYEVAELLLVRGASPDKVGPGGQTPLFKAVDNESLRMVELLLDNGSDPNKASRNQTPLKFAIRECKNDVLSLFIRYGFYNTGYRKNANRRASRAGTSGLSSMAAGAAEIGGSSQLRFQGV